MALSDVTLRKLNAPLDKKRVHSREGSGGRSLEYLATHDVIRYANAIFGYGQWGHIIDDLTLLAQEQVVSRDGKKTGFRVGYRCTVILTVTGCEPTSGVGYGDAMEYTDSSITPHELAAKEAESDALKRALKNYGDQFGLVLYAKPGEERQRVEREAALRAEKNSGGEPSAAQTNAPNASPSRQTRKPASPPVTPPDGTTSPVPPETPAGGTPTTEAVEPMVTAPASSPGFAGQIPAAKPAQVTELKRLSKVLRDRGSVTDQQLAAACNGKHKFGELNVVEAQDLVDRLTRFELNSRTESAA